MVLIEETYEYKGTLYKVPQQGNLVEQTFEHNGAYYKLINGKEWRHLQVIVSPCNGTAPEWVQIPEEKVPDEIVKESTALLKW